MQIPVMVRYWPKAEFDFPLGRSAAARLRTLARRIDIEWVLGATGWILLVIAIVQSGR